MTDEGHREIISQAFEASAAAKAQFLQDHIESLERVIDVVVEQLLVGGKILLFGNGGSAADAQHLAAHHGHVCANEHRERLCVRGGFRAPGEGARTSG
jgi:phosphoheptose isomerase